MINVGKAQVVNNPVRGVVWAHLAEWSFLTLGRRAGFKTSLSNFYKEYLFTNLCRKSQKYIKRGWKMLIPYKKLLCISNISLFFSQYMRCHLKLYDQGIFAPST